MAAPAERPATFTEAIDHWCQRTPEAMALRLLDERGEVAAERTYGDLGRAITAAAALVAQRVGAGDAAALLFPPGLEFIEAFFGCLKAGVVAVPVYPPDPMRLSATISRLVSIVDDARPAVILTDSLIAEHAELLFAEAPSLRRVPLVDVGAGGPSTAAAGPQAVSPEDVAFVQYSSGSTGEPKGVVLSHANLDANLRSIEAAFGIDPAVDTGLSWLPTYHDMGLIGAVIQPLTIGGLTYLMSPIDFLRRPWSWLEAMSRYGCTISGSPNFGYELCARKTPDEVVEQLDLTRWRVAFNGAEPLDPGTLEAFTERFAPAGFAAAAMLPCYGLAEATLLVSGKRPTDPPKVLTVDPGALSDSRLVLAHDGKRLVSCGRPSAGVEVRIVDPTTGEPLPNGLVGEIEVAGGSVARGYWARQPDRPAFREVDGRGWLRTGDLGGLLAGELVPTGRIKDVLVVRGRNVYPQDLERAAEAAAPTLRRGCSVAFAVEPGQDERIVVVTEVAGGDPTPELAEAISAAVAREGVRPAVVVLAPPHSVPKTSSGKVRRAACRAAWQSGTLGTLLERGTGDRERPESATGEGARAGSVAGTADLIRAEVERALDDPEAQLSGELVFADLGLDSAQLVELQTRLEGALGRPIPAEIMWSSPTIDGLARALALPRMGTGQPVTTVQQVVTGKQESPAPGAAAIIGIGLRVAGAEGPDDFWARLSAGDPDGELRPRPPTAAPRDRASRFDARFFGISAREAARMDPAHRNVLEVTWHALEDAGIDPRSLAGRRVGVFIGASPSEYGVVTAASGHEPDVHSVTGLAPALASNRISYLLDLRGPSLTVDTACSSSLVAVHLALRSLRSGECDLTIVGGVSALVATDVSEALASVGALSPTGACHAFDEAADGYVRGAGCGVVVLERHDDAFSSGRRCYALVRGTAVNQDGRSNGLTAPNPESQREVVEAAHQDAGTSPASVVAVEAHGTGTPLGDPIECGALRDVLGEQGGPVQLTSVKSVVGHLEAAAGILGLIRTALCADRGVLPRQAGFAVLNSGIDLGRRLTIPVVDQPWEEGLAGVSSFGFGGTNAHAVVARAGEEGTTAPLLDPGVLLLSATTPQALCARGRQVAELLRASPPADVRARLAPVAGTHRYRAVLPGEPAAAEAQVDRWEEGGLQPVARVDRLVVVFGGQGSTGGQGWHPDLLNDARLSDSLLALGQEAGQLGESSLRRWMGSDGADTTEAAQPLITIVSLTLLRTLEQLGIVPDLVLGHSVGEIAAMAAAGALTDAEAVRLAASRGRIMQEAMATGAMATILLGATEATAAISDSGADVAVAGFNAPTATGVAGPPEAMAVLHRYCDERSIALLPVAVDRAFHTQAVEPCRDALLDLGRDHPASASTRPLVTTADAEFRSVGWRAAEDHWYHHARQPVHFDAALSRAGAGGRTIFLEIGTHPMMSKLRRRCGEQWVALTGATADGSLLGSVLGQLHLAGYDVPWAAVVRGPVPRVPMPPYSFGGEHHWIDKSGSGSLDAQPAQAPAEVSPPEAAAAEPRREPSPARSGPSDPLYVCLAGLGIGPGSRIEATRLELAAEARARDVAEALGAELVGTSAGGSRPVDLALVPVGGTALAPGRSVTLDDTGCPVGALGPARRSRRPRLALAYFGDHPVGGETDLYADLIAYARRADDLGFSAVWTPERHFDSFGGPYPAPAVLSAALARETSRISVRAGSVVLPLSHPARVVEEWALVDSLSGGRAGIAIATGWRDRDRILAPTAEAPDIEASIDLVRRLWRGEEVDLVGPDGHVERARVRPQPVQAEAPLWLTVMKNPDSWRRAGRLGLDVLTNLLGRPIDTLGEAIETYQQERAAHGFGPGEVTVMLHAHLDADCERARSAAQAPLERYLAASATVFSQATGVGWLEDRARRLSPSEVQDEISAVVAASARRYLDGSSLIGSPESSREVLDRLGAQGVTEVAALVDFGFDRPSVLRTIELLDQAVGSSRGLDRTERRPAMAGATR